MALYVAFGIFIVSMVTAVILDFSMVIALLIGLGAFVWVGVSMGHSLGALANMSIGSLKESVIVLEVMAVIGFVTAVWRVSGTITVFVYYGIQLIEPHLFLVIAFLLGCLLSYALGTSFGVAGTVGVIFMALARSGGVDPILTAGVLMSAITFGDRGAPVSSCANMVAALTQTNILDNVRLMMRTAMVPFGVTLAIYSVLSFQNPITHVDAQLVAAFEEAFHLSAWAFVPAVFMLLLPLCKISVLTSMAVSIVSGVLVAWLVQGVPMLEILRICIFGYEASGEGLGSILNGGGLVSMIEIVAILTISSFYSGIFNGTGMLDQLQDRLNQACSKIGRFGVMVLLSIASACIFCNQTISTLVCSDLLQKPYLDGGGSRQELAIDMENSTVIIACMVPWSLGCAVPLSFFGVGPTAILYAVYMYGVVIHYLFRKKKWFPNRPA